MPALGPDDTAHAQALHQFFAGDGPRFLLWMDGMRHDVFEELHGDYVRGHLRLCWNGGFSYSGDWADRFLRRDFDRTMGFFSPVPLWGFDHADYDERDYFDVVPAPDAYDSATVADRLDALGYVAGAETDTDRESWRQDPWRTNAVVRDHLDEIDGGIIRYVAPHPPLVGLGELTSGRGKIDAVREALDSGALSTTELREAYRETARLALDAATDLIPDLPVDSLAEVIITADHGEALDEDCCAPQVFHARGHTKCGCITEVPWFVTREVVA